ncbi:MAG: J domain-containing protein [Bdellovibrionota bacterium]|jgi:DnaJ-class molecular chaperone
MRSQIDEKNYYELLGVPEDATRQQIKIAYREIALIYHPDSNFYNDIVESKNDKESEEIFKKITAAYHTLIQPKERARYNETLLHGIPKWEKDRPVDEMIRPNPSTTPRAFNVFGNMEDLPPSDEESTDNDSGRLLSLKEIRELPFWERIIIKLSGKIPTKK